MLVRVSDEVWPRLDPYAGQLARRGRHRLKIAAVIFTVVAVAVNAAWHGGLFVPRLAANTNGVGTGPYEMRIPVTIHNNNGWAAVRVLGAGRGGPGLELVEVAGFAPQTLPPGGELGFELRYRVTDCAAVPEQPWPVPVVVGRPWGAQTIHLHLPPLTGDDAPTEYSYSGRDPYAVEWQRYFAEKACR
jgi:hypothetical protein